MRARSISAITVVALTSAMATSHGQVQPGDPPLPGAPTPIVPDGGEPDVEPAPATAPEAAGSRIGEADAVAFRLEQPRTTRQYIILGSLAGGALVFGGAGLLFHLDSRSKSDEVSRLGMQTGLVWTQEREDTRKSALQSRKVAIVTYSIGGALAIASVVALILTEPEDKVVTYGAVPTDGGAIVGASWSFQ